MFDELLENWNINQEMNMRLLEIAKNHMDERPRPKAKTIEGHFQHIQNNRISWLEHITPVQPIDKDSTIKSSLIESSQAVANLIEFSKNGGEITGTKAGLHKFIFYLVSHESHHRGQIMLILRNAGVQVSHHDQYSLWDWK